MSQGQDDKQGALSQIRYAFHPFACQFSFAAKLGETKEALASMQGLRSKIPTPDETVRVFFELLGHSGQEKKSHYRQQFWQSYLDHSDIQLSHLIVAAKARQYVVDKFAWPISDLPVLQEHKKVDPWHAVLLMRIRHIVIAEWSHKGKCRIWLNSNPSSPQFFQSSYSRDSLFEFADHTQQHYFSERGLWQRDLSQWIASETRISLNSSP